MPTFDTTPAEAGDEPESISGYGGMDDLIAVAGNVDLRNYSNLDRLDVETSGTYTGAPTFDYDRIQRAMDDADAQVNQYLLDNGAASPASTSDAGFSLLREAWARLAVRWLSMARGSAVETDDAGNAQYKSNIWAKEARTLMQRFVLGKKISSFSTSVAFGGQHDRTYPYGYYPCG